MEKSYLTFIAMPIRHVGIFCLMLLFASVLVGQTSFGRISGNVTDATGAAVPNATVTISDPSTNFSRVVSTDESGFYSATNLPVGKYSILVEVPNFKKHFSANNVVNADSRLTVDVVLEVGQVAEVVEVTQTSGETVNTTSGEVAKVIDSQQVSNLALKRTQLLSIAESGAWRRRYRGRCFGHEPCDQYDQCQRQSRCRQQSHGGRRQQ